ncbi:MAG: hypothetical protein IJ301_00030 [Clostridia bacterium]|nr:hypothetical protein [Clostridia bacterium]
MANEKQGSAHKLTHQEIEDKIFSLEFTLSACQKAIDTLQRQVISLNETIKFQQREIGILKKRENAIKNLDIDAYLETLRR